MLPDGVRGRNRNRFRLDDAERGSKRTKHTPLAFENRRIVSMLRFVRGVGLLGKVRNRMQRRRCQARD